MSLIYCQHREHTERGTPAWFLGDPSEKLCQKHRAEKPARPRLRFVNGQWVKIEGADSISPEHSNEG